MPSRTGFRQRYTANNSPYNASTAGRRGQISPTGRYLGARQAFTDVRGDGTRAVGRGGRMVSRSTQYRDIRVGLGLSGG